MILYYFPIAQNTVNKTVSEKFYRGVQRCICLYIMCTCFTIFLFTGLIPVEPKRELKLSSSPNFGIMSPGTWDLAFPISMSPTANL